MDSLTGQLIAHYRVQDLLGEGGMGLVYRATDLTLQRTVALKVMLPHLARQEDFKKRFLGEAQTAAQLNHPGIVQVFQFGEANSLFYIVMEFIPGGTLQQLLEKLRATGQWIVLSEAVGLTRQVCLALDHAHRHGVLHRDIKPDNIMLKPEGAEGLPYRPVLTDLGLAKLRNNPGLTQTGTFMGSYLYVSPEQARGEETDARSDVYSLGILLYLLAVGKPPFPIRSVTEAIHYHTKVPPPPPRSMRADLPEPVEGVILRAMEKDPAARFPTAAGMAEALALTPKGWTDLTALTSVVSGAPVLNVTLSTVYQQSIYQSRGPSILIEFPRQGTGMPQDRITLLGPDKSSRSVALQHEKMKIGRGADNDIVLNDPQASKQHVEVTFDGVNYQVTDLGSANGTYMANFKLLPGVPEPWTPDKLLRVGKHYLRLERSAAGVVDPEPPRSDKLLRVGVLLPTTQFSVAPGASVPVVFKIINQGGVVDHFGVSVQGIPSEWLAGPSPRVQLLPGLRQDVTLNIQPPRSPKSRAGQYRLTLSAQSQDAPSEKAEATGTLTVEPYQDLSSSLFPERIRAGQPARVSVRNQGNAPETVKLLWRDQADELLFTSGKDKLNIREGEESQVSFTATPRRRRWIGGEKQHQYSLQVSPGTGEPLNHAGQVLSYGLVPAWVPPLAMALLLVLCGLLAALAANRSSFGAITANLPTADPRATLVSVAPSVQFQPTYTQTATSVLVATIPTPAVPISASTATVTPTSTRAPTATAMPTSTRAPTETGTWTPTIKPSPISTRTFTPTRTPTTDSVVLPACNSAPVISSFTSSLTSVSPGGSVMLSWGPVTNADTIEIDQGIGRVTAPGHTMVFPTATTTYTLKARCGTQTPITRQITVQILPVPPSQATILFDSLPDGTHITQERFLTGNEFSTWGVTFAAAPDSSYCSEATATAIRFPVGYGMTFHFLTTADPNNIHRCDTIPIAISFSPPIRLVTLTFMGANVKYTMKAYSSTGVLLNTLQVQGVLGSTVDASWASSIPNISRVTFGYDTAMTAIKQIYYSR